MADARDVSNVLFILVDDLGWRDLGCYGHAFHQTPNIDRLAQQGMRFTQAYAAAALCSPTRASILTGRYPARTGLTDWIPGDHNPHLPFLCPHTEQFMKLEEFTLAEALKAGGRRTAFVGKWHLGNAPYYPQHQGFDINIAGNHKGHPHNGYFSPWQLDHLEDGPEGEYLTDRLTDESIRILDQFSLSKDPWFLYLCYYTVHSPFQAKQETVAKYRAQGRDDTSARYAAMVESLDENVGRLLAWLEVSGEAEDTVVILFSDNGGFHVATENAPLRGYKGELYEGGIREPLIVRWPGVTRPGSTCDHPIISTDFYPTLLDITGLPRRPEQHLDGVSFVSLLRGGTEFDRGPMIWHYPHYVLRHRAEPGSAIRLGDWKYLEFSEGQRRELYDLQKDPGERLNLAKAMPEKALAMQRQLKQMLDERGAKFVRRNPRP